MVQLLPLYNKTTGKTIALTGQTFVNRVMSLLFNTLSGHSFSSKEQVSFKFMAAVTICSDFGAQENKVFYCFHCFPIYLPWSDGTGSLLRHFNSCPSRESGLRHLGWLGPSCPALPFSVLTLSLWPVFHSASPTHSTAPWKNHTWSSLKAFAFADPSACKAFFSLFLISFSVLLKCHLGDDRTGQLT